MMTEREKYLEHRIPVVRGMLRELETERQELRQKRMDAYLDRLESCNPAKAEAMSHD